jgi:hypothetical protein
LVRQGQLEAVFAVRNGVVSLRLVRSGRSVAGETAAALGKGQRSRENSRRAGQHEALRVH